MTAVLAVDVGGTTTKGAVVATDGRFLARRAVPTPTGSGPEAVVRTIRATVTELLHDVGAGDVSAVGVVVPGSVDGEAGVATYSANLGWHDLPLRRLVADDTGRPTVLGHDVTAAGIAETALGLAGTVPDSLLVVIGTGVAAVLRSGGREVTGASGRAGELGHLATSPDGLPCPCGQRGCLERYASAAGIARRYAEATGRTVRAEDVLALAPTDPVARRVWDEAAEALATGIAAYTMLVDPELVVIAGGLSAAGERLLDPLRTALSERVRWRQPPPVAISPLGARAGLLGAAILAGRAIGIADSAWTATARATG
jgi:glucokinase